MRFRKLEMARAVDLKDRRKASGLSSARLVELLGCADSKHLWAIESGRCAITMVKAARAACCLGSIAVEVDGVGRVVVTPVQDGEQTPIVDLRPGEAAWIAMEEQQEAISSIHQLQRAVSQRDREALISIYEQVVCDPTHAVSLVAASIDVIDPSIGIEARKRHALKVAAKISDSVAREAVPA